MEWYVWGAVIIIAALLEAGILWFFDKYSDIRAEKKQARKERTLPALSREEKTDLLKYAGLKRDEKNLIRLYYNANATERLFLLRHKAHITVIKEKLTIFDEEELDYASCYGIWEDDGDGFLHVYDSEETALKEWQKEIERNGYREEPLPSFSSNENN